MDTHGLWLFLSHHREREAILTPEIGFRHISILTATVQRTGADVHRKQREALDELPSTGLHGSPR